MKYCNRYLSWSGWIVIMLIGFLCMGLTQNAIAQDQVSGRVIDAQSGESLPGVNIKVKDTTTGTSTDANGEYELTVESLQDTLIFSFIGYQTATVPINGRSLINVQLQTQTLSGDELVIVGYGTQKKSSLTSSVSDISGAELEEKPVFNTRQILQGLAPGLTVTDRGGAPGSGDIRFRIRGLTTLNNNEPLIIVDGIEQKFSDLNPSDIASVSVLKDASATAIYGSRGASGVVLVTTKDGKEGDFSVSYDGYVAVQNVANKPEHMEVEPFLRLRNVALENTGSSPAYTEEEIANYRSLNAEDPYAYPMPNTMWDALFSPAPQQNHTLSVSGGTEQVNARLSTNFFEQDGIMPNFSAQGQQLRFNTNVKLSEALDVDAQFNYRRRKEKSPFAAGAVTWGLWQHNNFTVPKFQDGTYGLSKNGQNALMWAEQSGTRKQLENYLVANIKAELQLLDGLSLSTRYGVIDQSIDYKNHQNAFVARDFKDNSIRRDVGPNSIFERRDRNTESTWRSLLNYQLDLENHAFKTLLGYSEIRTDFSRLDAFRSDFYNNELTAISAGSESSQENGGFESEEGLRSVFGRINYSFDDKYLFQANARYDGSSKFYGSNNQYSFFPSFSVAWRISEEDFWNPISDVVNDFKIRGSWGEAGNNAVGLYTFFEALRPSSYVFNGQVVDAFSQGGIANPNLSWETTTQTNVGVDAQFLEGQFGLTFDYFKKRTDGILLTLPIPSTVGLGAPPQNAGVVDNWGWELQLTHRNSSLDGDFNYSITANLADVQNEVVDLAGTGPFIFGGASSQMQEVARAGSPLYSFYGYRALGYFESEEEIQNYPTFANKSNTFPGDLKYEDVNGDGQITADDRVPIGNQIERYTFGLNTNFNYKNFDLSFFIQGVGDVDKVIAGPAREHGIWGDYNFTLDIAKDYWTENNKDARFPRPSNRARKNTRSSNWWVIDASYVKLKNVVLGYNLPTSLTTKVGINRARFYVSGTNLITLSNATKWGIDPEAPSGRLTYYPQQRLFTLGVNITF